MNYRYPAAHIGSTAGARNLEVSEHRAALSRVRQAGLPERMEVSQKLMGK